jgi:hypothetical protein
MENKNPQQNRDGTMRRKVRFIPVAVLKHGILFQDGNMVYKDKHGRWLYVSEDGQTVLMYYDIAELIKDTFKHDDNDDFIVTGWDMYPVKFADSTDDAYNYYNARFDY